MRRGAGLSGCGRGFAVAARANHIAIIRVCGNRRGAVFIVKERVCTDHPLMKPVRFASAAHRCTLLPFLAFALCHNLCVDCGGYAFLLLHNTAAARILKVIRVSLTTTIIIIIAVASIEGRGAGRSAAVIVTQRASRCFRGH